MIDLIRKRHEGDGWIVFTELANRPGFYAKRYADAFALGVWATTKYEGHLYEEKISREDLKKELRDPTKADGVGKYASYRWLVVSDIKITEGLVIPDVWGILTPEVRGGSRLLKVVRKAPKLKPTPMDALFALTMVRNGVRNMVSVADHERMKSEYEARLRKKSLPTDDDLVGKLAAAEAKVTKFERDIERFESTSGVKIEDGWQAGNIGRAVKIVREMNDRDEGVDGLRNHVARLSAVAEQLDSSARHAASAAVYLRGELELREHGDLCRKKEWNALECSCGVEPKSPLEAALQRQTSGVTTPDGHEAAAGADDGEGSGGDRGGAGAPEQDAGLQLRD